MHYNTSYEGLEDQAKIDKGLEDIKDWLGEDRFDELSKEFEKAEKIPFEQFEFLAGMAGVQGYPVTAWYETVWPDV